MNEKVIMYNGERFYHSEWVVTREQVIERLNGEVASLKAILELNKNNFSGILFDNVIADAKHVYDHADLEIDDHRRMKNVIEVLEKIKTVKGNCK